MGKIVVTPQPNEPSRAHWRLTRELQPKLISHFLAVADNHSITRAAEVLNLTQPAISKSIKQLEDRLGVPLFERRPDGVRLTAYGEVLARRGRYIERELSHAVTELHSMKGGATGVIRIGAGLIWSQLYLPPVIARYQAARAGINIELQTGVIDTLVPRLIAGDLDIVCTTLDFPDSIDIVKEPLVDVRHGIFARAGHPLVGQMPLMPSKLVDWGWVGFKNDYVGNNRLGSFFAANDLGPPHFRMELVAGLTILSLIANTDYLCSLPLALAPIAAQQGVVRLDIHNAQMWSSGAGIAYRRTDYPTPAISAFLTMLRDSFSDSPTP